MKKWMSPKTWKKIAYTAIAFACWFVPSPIFDKGKWVDDNFLEEKIEEIVKEKTGVDIDLTPASPEKKEKG